MKRHSLTLACLLLLLAFHLRGKRFGELGYALRYRLGELPAMAVRGRESLFYRPDLAFHRPEFARVIDEGPGPRLRQLCTMARESGARLIALPVPPKSEVERESLPERLPPAS
jgi:hypothetical protein